MLCTIPLSILSGILHASIKIQVLALYTYVAVARNSKPMSYFHVYLLSPKDTDMMLNILPFIFTIYIYSLIIAACGITILQFILLSKSSALLPREPRKENANRLNKNKYLLTLINITITTTLLLGMQSKLLIYYLYIPTYF